MKLSLLLPKLVEKLDWVPVILFCFLKFSFPVTRLMPYYAETGCSRPLLPNRVTLQTSLNIYLSQVESFQLASHQVWGFSSHYNNLGMIPGCRFHMLFFCSFVRKDKSNDKQLINLQKVLKTKLVLLTKINRACFLWSFSMHLGLLLQHNAWPLE
jgi:hypothetical protein